MSNLFAHWPVIFDENGQFDQSQFLGGDTAALPLTRRWYQVDVVDIGVIHCGVGVQLRAANNSSIHCLFYFIILCQQKAPSGLHLGTDKLSSCSGTPEAGYPVSSKS